MNQLIFERAKELSRMNTKILISIRPVSYTHLDVYKRQEQPLTILRNFISAACKRLSSGFLIIHDSLP